MRAFTASRPSITQEMLISFAPWLIISMFTFPWPSVVNIRPEIPIMFRIDFPTRERMAISRMTWTCGTISDNVEMKECHVRTYSAALAQLTHDAVEHLFVVVVLDGHTDVDLAGTDEVDDDTELVERAEDRREEAV